jgi:hypothetical protein
MTSAERAAPTITASVQGPASTGGLVVDLAPGERLSFGSCGCAQCGHALVLATPRPGDLVGRVTASADHWRLDNLSVTTPLLCRDLEDATQLVRVGPGRLGVVIPFELAQVSWAGHGTAEPLTVFGPEPAFGAGPGRCCGAGGAPDDVHLNRGAAYYAVLEALCAPWLAGGPGTRLPRSADIAAELSRRGLRLTRRAVDHHIDYLVDRLGVGAGDEPGARFRRREALVEAAVLGGYVGDRSERLQAVP